MMCDGVFRQMWCGRSFFLGRPRQGRVGSSLAGSWPRVIGVMVGLPRDDGWVQVATDAIAWSPRPLRMW